MPFRLRQSFFWIYYSGKGDAKAIIGFSGKRMLNLQHGAPRQTNVRSTGEVYMPVDHFVKCGGSMLTVAQQMEIGIL